MEGKPNAAQGSEVQDQPGFEPTRPESGMLARRSIVVLFGGNIVVLAVGLVQQVVFGRLLDPEAFGLMGMCVLVTTFATLLTDTGFLLALIHRGTMGRRELDTFWTVSVARGALLTGSLLVLAGPLASLFSEPRLSTTLRLLAVVFILDGLANPALVLLRRDLQYKGIALQQAVAAVAGLAAGIALAFVTRSVWVLAVAYITVSLVRLTMSYLIRPYIPRLRFDLRLLRELSSYGRWVTGSNIALYLLNWGDNLVVSRFLGAQSLGLYQQAFLLSNLPATQITSVVGQVSFPYFAKLRAHNGVGPAYIRILHYVALVTVPTATLIFSVGPDAIRVVLGPKWVAMIVPLQILSIWGLIRSISTNSGPVFNAVGRPQIVMQQAALRLVVFGVLVVPMTNAMGIRGTALAVLLGALPVELLTYVRTLRACQSSIAAFSRALLVPVLGSSVMLVVVALVKEQFVRNLGIQRVLVEGALGVAAYLVTVALYYRITGDVPVSIREQLRFLGARWSSRGTADTQRACPRVGVPTEASETQQQA